MSNADGTAPTRAARIDRIEANLSARGRRALPAVRRWLPRLGVGLVGLAATFIFLVLCFGTTSWVKVEANTKIAKLRLEPDAPITWSFGDAQLSECTGHTQEAKTTDLTELESIVIPLANAASGRSGGLLEAVASIDGDAVVIELGRRRPSAGDAPVKQGDPACSAPSSLALLDADGQRRGLQLPAVIRIPKASIGNGLTLEFRGFMEIGSDLSNSRQPLLTSGRLTLLEVRQPWVRALAGAPQFEADMRELNLGDKLELAGKDRSPIHANAPRGLLRLTADEQGPTEMTVHAVALAARATLVRPFVATETPQATVWKRASRDDLIQTVVAMLGALWAAGLSLIPLLYKSDNPETPMMVTTGADVAPSTSVASTARDASTSEESR